MENYRNRITVNPKIHFGKPYIVGTNILFILFIPLQNKKKQHLFMKLCEFIDFDIMP